MAPRNGLDKEFIDAESFDQFVLILIFLHCLSKNSLEGLIDALIDPLYWFFGRHPCLLNLKLGFLIDVFDFLEAVLTRRSNHVVINDQKLNGLNHVAGRELLQ